MQAVKITVQADGVSTKIEKIKWRRSFGYYEIKDTLQVDTVDVVSMDNRIDMWLDGDSLVSGALPPIFKVSLGDRYNNLLAGWRFLVLSVDVRTGNSLPLTESQVKDVLESIGFEPYNM